MTAGQSVWRIVAAAMIAFSLLAGGARAADKPEMIASVTPEEIFIGESVDYMVEVRNSKNPTAPDISQLKDQFDLVVVGDQSRNQSSTYIINGKVTQQSIFSHVYHYRLTPRKPGLLTIPAVSATIDGKQLSSDPLPLNVIEVEKQDTVIVEIEADHPTVYPTQPFTVVVRILIQPLPNSADRDPIAPLRRQLPHLQINWVDPPTGLASEDKFRWLQPMMSEDGVGFTLNDVTARSGFFFENSLAVFTLPSERESRKAMNGKTIRYFVYELSRTFTPETVGEYTFGPAMVKGAFVTGADGNSYKAKRIVANSEAVTVVVRNVPTPRPATFCGGIGQYQARASASPTKLRIGDPMTLTVEIERGSQSGSLEMISAPDLSAIPQLMDDFDLIDKNPTGRVEGSVKKFSYALRPKRLNAVIPALTLHMFDPIKEQFVPIQTSEITLDVSEASRVSASELVGATPAKPPAGLKSRSEGIFQNITDLNALHDERIDLGLWSEVTIGIWAVAACLMLGLNWRRQQASDPDWVRRRQARKVAHQRLAEARKFSAHGNSLEALRTVRAALVSYVADTRRLIAEGLTTTEIVQQLERAEVPADNQQAFERLLEAIESAEYGAIRAIEPAVAIDSATQLIGQVASYLEKGT